MKIFAWKSEERYFIDDDGQVLLSEKPVFSFEYDTIFYSDTLARKNETIPLNDSEKDEIDNFISNYKLANNKAFCVDNNGNYLGYVEYVEGVNNKVPYPSPDSTFIWNSYTKVWDKKYFYDSTGHHTAEENAVGFTTQAPPSDLYVFSSENNSWTLNKVVSNDMKILTKIKFVGALLYYMEFVYGNQNHVKEVISSVKQKAITDNKNDLVSLCDSITGLIDQCDALKDKEEFVDQLSKCLIQINQKVLGDVMAEEIFLETDIWRSVDRL